MKAALVIVVLWALGWGLGYGGITEAFVDPDGKIGDIWPVMLGIPGLIGGIIFALLLLVVEGGRAVDQIPLAHIGIGGLLVGVILGLLSIPAGIGDVSPGAAGVTGMAVLLCLVAAMGTAIFFRLVGRFASRSMAARSGEKA